MKLYPCVLLGDAGTMKMADTVGTAQAHRWSTTDNVNFSPSLTRAQMLWDRRSLRIATGAGTAGGDRVEYGVAATDLDTNDVLNSFGTTVDDFSWCTDLACWLYNTEDKYSAGDPDQFQLFVTDNATSINVNWTALTATDRWLWVNGTPASGTFAANGTNIEQFGFKATAAFTAASYFYINSFVAYRSTLSTTGNDYFFGNAIDLATSSFIPTDQNSWRVSGNIVGDRPVDLARQLHEMSTLDLSIIDIVRRPTPKYQSLRDCDVIKTYLMYVSETLGQQQLIANSGKTTSCAVPVIISNVSTEFVAPSKSIISFQFDAFRFAGC